ncbi:MAG TPA: glucose-6-phosphate isomerase [Acidothermaceae bacterium]|jgi:glucose-6-phosphate isomerase|nr:glucose-6-phosphate isomerase [Acidothermaceae bacterium]
MSHVHEATEFAGVNVRLTGADYVTASKNAERELAESGFAAKLAKKDATLWGDDAQHEASIRLGWLDLPKSSWQYVAELAELREQFEAAGLEHVVLAGMGGSSLAPEVIAATAGVRLTVLDTTDAGQVASAIADDLGETVLVVSSKSGGTIETDSHKRAYEQAFREAGINPVERIVVVTDPGSPLEKSARDAGYRVFLADPNVGGRYSALSAFGLVPSALAGVDVEGLLRDAQALGPSLDRDLDNPGLTLGAALGEGGRAGRDKVIIADFGSRHPGFGDWAEQLIAESTGKLGTGLLPVVVESVEAPDFAAAPDRQLVTLGGQLHIDGITVSGNLGAEFVAWEYATAVAGRLLGINPFDQPNVQESKDNTNKILDAAGDGPLPEGRPVFVDGSVEVHTDDPILLGGAGDLRGVLAALLRAIPDRGYLAVMAYLDRHTDASVSYVRRHLANHTQRPVTFGWAPRFLHSTGQYHKGGPQVGAFLQITGAVEHDLAIPGRPFGFQRLQMAQALGDLRALQQRGRPAIRLHFRDRTQGIQQLLDAAGAVR